MFWLALAKGDERLGKELVARLMNEMNRNAQRGVSAEVTALFAPDLALQYVTDILGCLLGIAGLVSK